MTTFSQQGLPDVGRAGTPADVVVTATGLKLLALGGIRLTVDGVAADPSQALAYKGLMLGNVPNCAICVGYTNASWTLRADLASLYVCRLLHYMARRGSRLGVPRHNGSSAETQQLLDLKSGYVLRKADQFPKQGRRAPWVLPQNYLADLLTFNFGAVNDGTFVFSYDGAVAAR